MVGLGGGIVEIGHAGSSFLTFTSRSYNFFAAKYWGQVFLSLCRSRLVFSSALKKKFNDINA